MVLPLPACQCPEYEVAYQPAGRGIPPPPQRGCRVGDPGPWRRCSSLKYFRYSRSSRLASTAPRSGILASYFALGTLASGFGAVKVLGSVRTALTSESYIQC